MENKFLLLDAGRRSQIGCYAGIPGTGPSNAICAGCIFLVPDGSKRVCAKYHRMMERKGKPISGNTPACRHFKPRRLGDSTKASSAGDGGDE